MGTRTSAVAREAVIVGVAEAALVDPLVPVAGSGQDGARRLEGGGAIVA